MPIVLFLITFYDIFINKAIAFCVCAKPCNILLQLLMVLDQDGEITEHMSWLPFLLLSVFGFQGDLARFIVNISIGENKISNFRIKTILLRPRKTEPTLLAPLGQRFSFLVVSRLNAGQTERGSGYKSHQNPAFGEGVRAENIERKENTENENIIICSSVPI